MKTVLPKVKVTLLIHTHVAKMLFIKINVECLVTDSCIHCYESHIMFKRCMTNYQQWRKVVWAQGYCDLQLELSKRCEQLVVVQIGIIENVKKKRNILVFNGFYMFYLEVFDDDLICIYFFGTKL